MMKQPEAANNLNRVSLNILYAEKCLESFYDNRHVKILLYIAIISKRRACTYI